MKYVAVTYSKATKGDSLRKLTVWYLGGILRTLVKTYKALFEFDIAVDP